jgi:metal-responsive CopG/Arc/MetJ family transcriptional regulator
MGMTRILVDLPEGHVQDLSFLATHQKRSRAAIIREAIAIYIKQCQPANLDLPQDAMFGVWRDREMDGVQYQKGLRSEW